MTHLEANEKATTYPVLATRTDVVMPGVLVPLEIGRSVSRRAIDSALDLDDYIVAIPQKDPNVRDPGRSDLFEVGVLCEILQVSKPEEGRYSVTVRAIERQRIEEITEGRMLKARVSPFSTVYPPDRTRLHELAKTVRESLSGILSDQADDPDRVRQDLEEVDDPDELVDLAAAHLTLERELELELLAEENVQTRLEKLLPALEHEREVTSARARIRQELEDQEGKEQRESLLRERAREIAEELGEGDEEAEADDLWVRVKKSKMPEEARAAALKQIARLRIMPTISPEYMVTQNYIQWLLDIPWGEESEGQADVAAAREILDNDHAGLEKVKKRILEFIAVRQLAPNKQGPILCLVGPPGVGKTSLGRSIATALGRQYVRASLGGVRDDAEIRGHRRTYIGALPGRIASSLKQAGTMNPVFVLDEIDKLAQGVRGDPASALLEALDPEQNSEFSDHYLEVPLDLSKVLFFATANQTDTIPPALLDRMELIQIPGYTDDEKLVIAKDHLMAKQVHEHGLDKGQVEISESALLELIHSYTREAGVRNLEREIAALCRSAAVKVAEGAVSETETLRMSADSLPEVLGPPRYTSNVAHRSPQLGVSTALAWTPLGGEILFIEARRMPGKGKLEVTGQMGEVMRESVQAALSWVRANASHFEISPELFASSDIHVHVPEGATPKDGPSAGVAIATALASAFSGRAVRPDAAITGELTLRGRVLPVGGIKGKVLAAHRGGVKTVILAERNEKDLVEIPEAIRAELDVHLVKSVDEAITIALSGEKSAEARGTSAPPPPPFSPPPRGEPCPPPA